MYYLLHYPLLSNNKPSYYRIENIAIRYNEKKDITFQNIPLALIHSIDIESSLRIIF